jgi:hypothetical protein
MELFKHVYVKKSDIPRESISKKLKFKKINEIIELLKYSKKLEIV